MIADLVNPMMQTRNAWRAVGETAGAAILEVELICSDAAEHRRRVEQRAVDVPGLRLPDWDAVEARNYQPWNRERMVLDTSVARHPGGGGSVAGGPCDALNSLHSS